MADLCFQMYAEVKDVDELLEMIRSTALTDYIRLDLNGDGDTNDNYDGQPESQPLQLMNPAGLIKKYLMPNGLPSTIHTANTITLNKGYYKGVVFDIPGAEVEINGEWIAYSDANKSLIMSQNPMTLEWRLNGDLLRKFGYSSGQSISGCIIVVDDQWHGLNISKDVTIHVTQ